MRRADAVATPKDIDQYLTMVEEPARTTLQKVRKSIHAAVPKGEEVISYQIPTFKYLGALVGFAIFKKHCSFFTMSHACMKELADDLKDYETTGITIHFPFDKPLPAALIKKIVKFRMKENEMADVMKRKK